MQIMDTQITQITHITQINQILDILEILLIMLIMHFYASMYDPRTCLYKHTSNINVLS